MLFWKGIFAQAAKNAGLLKAGSSDGAKKGWETRRGGGSSEPDITKPPKDVMGVYDLGPDAAVADRYTVLLDPKQGWEASSGRVQSISLSGEPDHPQGVSQMGEAVEGKHLGKKVAFSDLPENVRRHIHNRLK